MKSKGFPVRVAFVLYFHNIQKKARGKEGMGTVAAGTGKETGWWGQSETQEDAHQPAQ